MRTNTYPAPRSADTGRTWPVPKTELASRGLWLRALCIAGALTASFVLARRFAAPLPVRTTLPQVDGIQADVQAEGMQAHGVALASASLRVQTTPNTPALIRVEVETASTLVASPEAVGQWAEGIVSDPAPEGGEGNEGAAWPLWAHLEAPRARTTLLPPSVAADATRPDLRVLAVRWANGATVCLRNRAERAVTVDVRTALPEGTYLAERLTWTPDSAEGRKETAAATSKTRWAGYNASAISPQTGLEHVAPSPTVRRLERLEGRDLSGRGTLAKTCTLQSGQVCLLRFTDQAALVRHAWGDAHTVLSRMAAQHAAQSQRLRRMLDEASPAVRTLRPGSTRHNSAGQRLAAIHRLLLVTAQAHSLHHNYQMRQTVDGETGGALMGTLERLGDALSETSGVLLGLVPQVEMQASPVRAGEQAGGRTTQTVAITLANTGRSSIEMVKLGVGSLPSLIACNPGDPAFFGTLRPGQSVRAVFRLEVSPSLAPDAAGVALREARARCAGDVSYFTAGTPAHLRPRPQL